MSIGKHGVGVCCPSTYGGNDKPRPSTSRPATSKPASSRPATSRPATTVRPTPKPNTTSRPNSTAKPTSSRPQGRKSLIEETKEGNRISTICLDCS